MVSNEMLFSTMNSVFSEKSFVMLCEECLQISIYIYPFFIQCVTRHVVGYDKLLFQPEIICNAVWRKFPNIYLFLPLTLSIGAKRDVVPYDEFSFQREIICDVVCEQCLQISLYVYPLFYQMVSHDMLLSMMISDFSQKSFVILCEAS